MNPFLGQILLCSFNYPPKGFASCNGQLLQINQNQALFSLLGTMYGGDGRTTFGLPNLQGVVPMHFGNGYAQGQTGGEANHTLTVNELPAHTHPLVAASGTADQVSPSGNYPATSTANNGYASSSGNTTLGPGSNSTGGGQAHPNLQPYLTINYCIALQGIYPSRN